MTGIKQNTYSTEFKESTVKLAKESRQSIAQTARELGMITVSLNHWIYTMMKTLILSCKL